MNKNGIIYQYNNSVFAYGHHENDFPKSIYIYSRIRVSANVIQSEVYLVFFYDHRSCVYVLVFYGTS